MVLIKAVPEFRMSPKGDTGFGFFSSALETVTGSAIVLRMARKAVDKETMARWINERGSDRMRGLNLWLEGVPPADLEIRGDQHVQSNRRLFIHISAAKQTEMWRGIHQHQLLVVDV